MISSIKVQPCFLTFFSKETTFVTSKILFSTCGNKFFPIWIIFFSLSIDLLDLHTPPQPRNPFSEMQRKTEKGLWLIKMIMKLYFIFGIKYDISAYVCLTEITSTSYRNRDTCETINECVKIQLKLSTVIHVNNHSSEACR